MLIFTDGGPTLCPTSVQSKQCSLWSAEFRQTSIYGSLNANGVLHVSYRNRCLHRRSSANSEDSDRHDYYSTGFIETPIIDSTDNRDRYHTETQPWFMGQLLNPLLFFVCLFFLSTTTWCITFCTEHDRGDVQKLINLLCLYWGTI